jgi:hypothetical protein
LTVIKNTATANLARITGLFDDAGMGSGAFAHDRASPGVPPSCDPEVEHRRCIAGRRRDRFIVGGAAVSGRLYMM